MGKLNKMALILTIIMISSSLMFVELANAQTIPKPSIPEFTLHYIDNSYDVPTTYKIDEFTGQKVVNVTGTHVQNISIVVTIKNQEFSDSSSGATYALYYNIRYKGHFGDDWIELFPIITGFNSREAYLENVSSEFLSSLYHDPLPASVEPQYTVVRIPANYASEAEVDVQVRAMFGYSSEMYEASLSAPTLGHMASAIECEAKSNWSQTETITVPTSSGLPSASPTVPELSWLAMLPLLLSVTAAAMFLWYGQKRKTVADAPADFCFICTCVLASPKCALLPAVGGCTFVEPI
ncbi:MAG: hypothetical protein NWE93_05530 [Candidatus Bathyarchaeota archaeon]|nr:hypothetical protein [Candidatus Bathyarchaeota archaeon]